MDFVNIKLSVLLSSFGSYNCRVGEMLIFGLILINDLWWTMIIFVLMLMFEIELNLNKLINVCITFLNLDGKKKQNLDENDYNLIIKNFDIEMKTQRYFDV